MRLITEGCRERENKTQEGDDFFVIRGAKPASGLKKWAPLFCLFISKQGKQREREMVLGFLRPGGAKGLGKDGFDTESQLGKNRIIIMKKKQAETLLEHDRIKRTGWRQQTLKGKLKTGSV